VILIPTPLAFTVAVSLQKKFSTTTFGSHILQQGTSHEVPSRPSYDYSISATSNFALQDVLDALETLADTVGPDIDSFPIGYSIQMTASWVRMD
jgi:hypothetical protein